MKAIKLLTVFSFFTLTLNAQTIDTIPKSTVPVLGKEIKAHDLSGIVGPSFIYIRELNYKMILNRILISDTSESNIILKRYGDKIKKMKYYSSSQALKKYGISSPDGLLVGKIKKGAIIDLKNLK